MTKARSKTGFALLLCAFVPAVLSVVAYCTVISSSGSISAQGSAFLAILNYCYDGRMQVRDILSGYGLNEGKPFLIDFGSHVDLREAVRQKWYAIEHNQSELQTSKIYPTDLICIIINSISESSPFEYTVSVSFMPYCSDGDISRYKFTRCEIEFIVCLRDDKTWSVRTGRIEESK